MKTWIQKTFTVSILTLLALQSPTHAQDTREAKAISQLESQIALIESIEEFVERLDLARLYVLKLSSQNVLNSIQDHKRGYGHRLTIKEYEQLVLTYRHSTAFFKMIDTQETKDTLKELADVSSQIAIDQGLDENLKTFITYNTYKKINELIHSLKDVAMPEELKQKLNALTPALGKLLGATKEGDEISGASAAAAKPVYDQLIALYPEMNKIAASDAAFNIILEIQGLNEYYAEAANDFKNIKEEKNEGK